MTLVRDARAPAGRARRPGAPELAIAFAFAALSLWVLVLDLHQVVAHGLHWTGTDGIFVTDQMSYLAWIQDASRHVLASNLFELRATPTDFLQPLVAISGGLSALGVAPWLSLLLWKPVAVGGVVVVAWAYVRRSVGGRWERRAAFALGLFFVGPGAFLASDVLHSGPAASLQWSALTLDASLGFWSWGYSYGLISVAAALGAVLLYERARTSRRLAWAPALLGALASWLHPWQGATLILMLVGAESLALAPSVRSSRSGRIGRGAAPIRLLAVTVTATVLPLLYFVVLDRADRSWGLAQSAAHNAFPVWMVLATVAPLAIPAALAYRTPARGLTDRVSRCWPFAALIVFGVSETRFGAVPTHALLGISIPFAVLAVQGVQSISYQRGSSLRSGLIAALIAIVLLAPTWHELSTAQHAVTPGPQLGQATGAVFVTAGERDALRYLDHDPTPGGVMSRVYLGTVVPGLTARRTFVGNFYYSPHYALRVAATQKLFTGGLTPPQARSLVTDSGARFLLADCDSSAHLLPALAPIVRDVRHFGCATVYRLR
ncbi:MAG TPA: hypothetical protein VIL16_09700 [Trebonia sp.]